MLTTARFSALVVALACLEAPAFGATSAAKLIAVPAKTPIKLVSDSVVVSTVAINPGDELDFHVGDAVIVDGYVVIPANAKAIGHFVSGGGIEMHQRLFSTDVHQRNVVFSMDYVISADGKKIELNHTNQSPPVTNEVESHGLFGHKNAGGIGLINKGTQISATVDHTVHVEATEQGSAGSDYDK